MKTPCKLLSLIDRKTSSSWQRVVANFLMAWAAYQWSAGHEGGPHTATRWEDLDIQGQPLRQIGQHLAQ